MSGYFFIFRKNISISSFELNLNWVSWFFVNSSIWRFVHLNVFYDLSRVWISSSNHSTIYLPELRRDYRSGGTNIILDVWGNDATENVFENLSGKSTISKSGGEIVSLISALPAHFVGDTACVFVYFNCVTRNYCLKYEINF